MICKLLAEDLEVEAVKPSPRRSRRPIAAAGNAANTALVHATGTGAKTKLEHNHCLAYLGDCRISITICSLDVLQESSA